MADITINAFPFEFISTGSQVDRLIFRNNPELVLTAFGEVVTAGTVQFAIGGSITSASPVYSSASGKFLIGSFGGDFGELFVQASAASVEVAITFAL
jgi:hypothetical protein